MLLKLEGFDVVTAASESEALEALATRTPDLLITDYHLRGGATGVEVVRLIRNNTTVGVPAILVSGDTSDAIAVNELGETSFLTKPVDTDDLLSEIRKRIKN
jgi:DNA-binding response OmpR family regulator